MMANIIHAVKNTLVGCAHAVGRSIKRLLKPASAVAAASVGAAQDLVRSRSELLAENALLRQQVIVLERSAKRPVLGRMDWLVMVILARLNCAWEDALHLVQPDTLLRWHRDLSKIILARRSRRKGQPHTLAQETINLIKEMAVSNPTWGAERIRGELMKLGTRVSKRTIQKYIRQVGPRGRAGQTWRTFVRNHSSDTWACDFLQLHDTWFRPIFAFFIVNQGTREVMHFNVTRSQSDEWTAQQIRSATPWGEGPRFLIRDNDSKFGAKFDAAVEGAGAELVKIPPKSPNLNPICEPLLRSVRQECLDHTIILGEDHLLGVLRDYVEDYFNIAPPHQGLGQQIAKANEEPQGEPSSDVKIVAHPILGGLHHDYRRAA